MLITIYRDIQGTNFLKDDASVGLRRGIEKSIVQYISCPVTLSQVIGTKMRRDPELIDAPQLRGEMKMATGKRVNNVVGSRRYCKKSILCIHLIQALADSGLNRTEPPAT
jgi:hypothetical protein